MKNRMPKSVVLPNAHFLIVKIRGSHYNLSKYNFQGGSRMLLEEAYKILELPEGANRAKIRHAYANLSKLYHVETHPEEFARLHEAYKLALSAAGTGAQVSQKENFKAEKTYLTSPFSEEEENISNSFSKKTLKSQDETNNFIDDLINTSFSIQSCHDLIQLIYYRCRYDEISLETDAALLRITNAEQNIADELQIGNETPFLPYEKEFFHIPFLTWVKQDWTCIVCHPTFYRMQYTERFLSELYHLLLEETLNLRDGIRQELYFALCMAYGFFLDNKGAVYETTGHPLLAKIKKLLSQNPRHGEYIKDLEIWPDCQRARSIVLFCQKVYTSFLPANQPVPYTDKNDDNNAAGDISLAETAAKLLLDPEILWEEFIYDCLTDFLDATLSGQLVKNREIFHQFVKKRQQYLELSELRQEFTRDFLNLMDNNIDENYIYNACYVPLATRLERIKDRYLAKKEWKKIICRPDFFQAFKNWLLRPFSSVPCLMHYDSWKFLRTCFCGSSPFEMDCIRYLTTEFYFPEYEKRYKRELIWEDAHIEEEYFKEVFPIPALSEGKHNVLTGFGHAKSARIMEIEKIFGNLTFDLSGLDFLSRIANAMTHFNFLLVTQKHEKEAVTGDAFCFFEDRVLLYRKKENLLCRLTHPVFYDLISWKFESAAFHVITGKTGYDDNFLDSACKNLYCYRFYAQYKRNDSPEKDDQ